VGQSKKHKLPLIVILATMAMVVVAVLVLTNKEEPKVSNQQLSKWS